MLPLGAWLLYVDRKSRAIRALAIYLILRGLLDLTYAASFDPILGDAPDVWVPPFHIAVPFAALYFAWAYHRRSRAVEGDAGPPGERSGLWTGSAVPLLLLAGGLAAEAAFLLDPSLWAVRTTTAAGPALVYGPLNVFDGLRYLAYATVALVAAVDYVQLPAGPARRSAFLVSIGFLLDALYTASVEIVFGDLAVSGLGFGPFGGVNHVLRDLVVVPALAAIVLLALHARRVGGDDPEVGRDLRRYVGLALLPVLSAVVVLDLLGLGLMGPAAAGGAIVALDGFWSLTNPLIVTYAVLQHRLLGLDVKVQATVKRSAIAAVFIAVFFLVGEGGEVLVEASVGPVLGEDLGFYLGIGAAAALAFALRPLERLADRLAHAAVPAGRTVEGMSADERLTLYREQLRIALADGRLEPKEVAFLANLQKRLELSDDDVRHVEEEVLGPVEEAGTGPDGAGVADGADGADVEPGE